MTINEITYKYLTEAAKPIKSKLTQSAYGKRRVIEGWKGYDRLFVHRSSKLKAYCVTSFSALTLNDMVEINGEFWFGTLKELHDALNA